MPYYLEESRAQTKYFPEGMYLPMINSETRLTRYHEYFELHAQDKVILDVGAGLGLIGLKALEHGAKHVYLVEQNPETAMALKAIVARHPHGARATVLHADFHYLKREDFGVEPDVLVCEFWGPHLWNEGLHATHLKARELFPNIDMYPAKYRSDFNIVRVPHDEYQIWPREQLNGVDMKQIYKDHYRGFLIEHWDVKYTDVTVLEKCLTLDRENLEARFEKVVEADYTDVFLHLYHTMEWHPGQREFYRHTLYYVPELREGQKIKVRLNDFYLPVFTIEA